MQGAAVPGAVPKIEVILVPTGAEYQAVQRGMRLVQHPPRVVPIPAGPIALQAFLARWAGPALSATGGILLMGLGGSLSPRLGVGDRVLVEALWDGRSVDLDRIYPCHGPMTQGLGQRLPDVTLAHGVTCDRVITTLAEKRQLGDRYGADVVDMEGVTLLQGLPNCPIAILRVISDDCHHELPDISAAIGPEGSLKPMVLTGRFLQRPLAALRLIRGSLQSLKALEHLAVSLCA
jgi:hypothetical protein